MPFIIIATIGWAVMFHFGPTFAAVPPKPTIEDVDMSAEAYEIAISHGGTVFPASI